MNKTRIFLSISVLLLLAGLLVYGCGNGVDVDPRVSTTTTSTTTTSTITTTSTSTTTTTLFILIADQDNNRLVRMDDISGTNWTTFGSYGSGTNQFRTPWGIFVR